MPKRSSVAVRDWMSRRVVAMRPDAHLGEAARVMRDRKVRHLPVVERGGRLVGIVTARDLRRALLSPAVDDGLANLDGVLATVPVRDVMSRRIVSVRASAPLREAARLMYEHNVGALPVMERTRLVGMLTETDLLAAVQRTIGAGVTSA
jgi:acetoin utilization protein AcuB